MLRNGVYSAWFRTLIGESAGTVRLDANGGLTGSDMTFSLVLVIRILMVAGHPWRLTTAAPRWPMAGGAIILTSLRARYDMLSTAPFAQQSQSILSNLVAQLEASS